MKKQINGPGYAHQMRVWLGKSDSLDARHTEGHLMVGSAKSRYSAGILYYYRRLDDNNAVQATLTPTRPITADELRNSHPEDELEGVEWRVSLSSAREEPPMFFDTLVAAVAYLYLVYE